MKSARAPLVVLLLAYGAFFTSLVDCGTTLPGTVASHFDVYGNPDSWMSRTVYLISMGVTGLLIPLLAIKAGSRVRSSGPAKINIPNRQYWLDSTRIQQTKEYLFRHFVWFSALLVYFLTGLNGVIVRSNLAQPKRLLESGLFPLLGGFVGATVVWILALYLRFKKRP